MAKPMPVRLKPDLLSQLDHLAALMSKRSAGVSVSRSAVMRLCIERGLDVVEKEFGLPKTPRPTKGKR